MENNGSESGSYQSATLLGLRHREILQLAVLQCDPRGAERSRHVPGGSTPLLHQRDGLQHHGGAGQLPQQGGPG